MQVSIKKYGWSDLCFVMNFRGVAVKANTGVVGLKEMMGQVQPEESEALDSYISPPAELVEQWAAEGWFNKTYDTVKHIVSTYVKKATGDPTAPRVVYTQKADPSLSSRQKIQRILMFHHLKNCPVRPQTASPSREQEKVVKFVEGVLVVNSGPGTGKTETGIHKASELSGEGVLVFSYTNAAVDTFRMRLQYVTDDISKVGTRHGSAIWVTTIDSLAALLTPNSQKGVDFEMTVESAVRDITRFGHIFLKLDGTPMYKHIILDEGQDVSESRYNFVRCIYERWGFKSLTVLGDPRQRLNIKCGGCFQKMLMDGTQEEGDGKPSFDKPLVVNFTQTYRFKDVLLLELANTLSALRRRIHVPLTYNGEKVGPTKLRKFQKPEEIAADIIDKVEKGVRPSDIAILSPVINKGKSKSTVERIVDFLKSGRDPTQEEREGGNTQPKTQVMTSRELLEDSVYVSSIQSVKGLEFDHVYFVGASGYPSYMVKEYGDINDGISMNFVANTRARLSITYLVDDSLRAPDNVPEEMTLGGVAKEATFTRESYPVSVRSSDITLENYTKFFQSNLMSVKRNEVSAFLSTHMGETTRFATADGMYEIISAVLAKLRGHSIIHGVVGTLPPRDFADRVSSGEIYDLLGGENPTTGVVAEGMTLVKEADLEMVKSLREGYDVTDLEMHQLFKRVMTGRSSMLRKMEQINDIVMKLSRLLVGEAEDLEVRQVAFRGYINASGLQSSKATLVFTENVYLAALVSKRVGVRADHVVYQVGLESGKIWVVPCPRTPILQLEYMVKSLYSIYAHMRLVRLRGRYSLAEVNESKPWYFVDTEYCPRDHRKSGTIYDIALINGFDPYASLCTLVSIEPDAFNRLNYLRTARGVPVLPFSYAQLEGAPKARQVYEFFCSLTDGKDPLIWYFNAKEDISIFYEFHQFYEEAWQRKSDQKSDWEFQWHLTQESYKRELDPSNLGPYDFRFKDAMRVRGDGTATNRANVEEEGSLSVRYQRLIGRDPERFPHILLHTAVSDTLLLMEYVQSRELAVE